MLLHQHIWAQMNIRLFSNYLYLIYNFGYLNSHFKACKHNMTPLSYQCVQHVRNGFIMLESEFTDTITMYSENKIIN